MQQRNPYAPPAAAVQDVDWHDGARTDAYTFVPYGRRRPASHGLDWIVTSWTIFKQRPGLWILAVIVAYVVFIGLSLIPFVNLAVAVGSPLLSAGLAAMAHAGFRGDPYGAGDLLSGFRSRTGPLLAVGVTYVVLWAAITAVLVALDGPVWMEIALGSVDPQALEGRLLVLLAYVVLTSSLSLLIVFAPALVFLNGVPPVAAMRMSLVGCLKNLLPGILCAAAMMGMIVLSIIPLGLGLLVTIPLLLITIYAAYRDVFLIPATA